MSSSNSTPDKPIYVVFESAGHSMIAAISNDPETAQTFRDSGHEVVTTTATIAATQLFLTPSLHSKMADSTWNDIAQGMEQLHQNHIIYLSDEAKDGFFSYTPIDLPRELALKRLDRLRQFPSPANIPTQRELTEIVMAKATNRDLNLSLFTDTSLNSPSWDSQIEGMSPEDLCTWETEREAERSLIAQANKERENRGQPVPREELLKEAQLLQELMEVGITRRQKLFLSLTGELEGQSSGPSLH